MLSEKNKTIIILFIFVIGLTINVLSLAFDFSHNTDYSKFLFDIGLTRWGWLPAFVFFAASLSLTISWKPYTRILRGFIITISILMLIYDLLWLSGIYFISHLHF